LKSKIFPQIKRSATFNRAPHRNKVSRQSLTFVTARAAFAAVRARLTAVFAVADDHHVFHIDARRRLRRLLFHRTRIRVLFTARAAHRAFAVFAAIRHAAARIFVFGCRGRAVLLVHRAMRRRHLPVIRRVIIVSEDNRRQSENQHRRQRYQDSIFHIFSFQNLEIKLPFCRNFFSFRRENKRFGAFF
jgi:hypothetical protein